MTDQSTKSRFAIDIDELERQLRQSASTGPVKSGVAADPLAELARIVGRDDPFKVMFEQQKAEAVAAPRVEPVAFAPAAPAVPDPVAPQRAAEESLRGALSEFDSLLRDEFGPRPAAPAGAQEPSISPAEADQLALHIDTIMREQQGGAGPRTEPEAPPMEPAYEPVQPVEQDDLVPLEPRNRRKGMMMIGGLVGIAVIGVGGAIAFKPGPRAPGGEPPTIKASVEPTKIQPQNPGGAEVPNQNRQILDRQPEAKPAETKVVTSEEQPMDVQAAARQASRVVLPGGSPFTTPPAATEAPAAAAAAAASPAPATQPATPPATSPLGEPRRVRTVAIRPDGSVIGQPPASGAPMTGPSAPSITAMGAPAMPSVAPSSIRPAAPAPAATTTPAQPKVAERVAAAPAQPQPPAAAPRPQPAAPAAARPAPTPAPAASAPPADATQTTGGFSVQLGAPGSEAEARTSFASLQRRFPDQLGGRAPVVRKAELPDGRTVYRLRVGPLSRESAASLCQELQSSGGSCFVARN